MPKNMTDVLPVKICDHCGQDIDEYAERFGIRAYKSPLRAHYRGEPILGVAAQQLRCLYTLCEKGRASNETCAWRGHLSEPASLKAVQAHMWRLRYAIIDQIIPVQIVTVDGWGYLLRQTTQSEAEMAFAKAHRRKMKAIEGERTPTLATRIGGRNGQLVAEALDALKEEFS